MKTVLMVDEFETEVREYNSNPLIMQYGLTIRHALMIWHLDSEKSNMLKTLKDSRLKPLILHHCGVEKWSSCRFHKPENAGSNPAYRNQKLPARSLNHERTWLKNTL